MKHILFLPSWYPTRNHPLTGDFIQRYAIAASQLNTITVLYCEKDPSIRKTERLVERVNERLLEYRCYYPESRLPGRMLKRAVSGLRRFLLLRRGYREVFGAGRPDLVQVHVAYHAGEFALYLLRRKKLRYIISEQHGQYMPEYNRFEQLSPLEKAITRRVYRHALLVHTISQALGRAMTEKGLLREAPVVIPNVVDSTLFYPERPEGPRPPQFVHVSMLTHQKNPDGMLRAFGRVRDGGYDFCLHIAGPVPDELRRLCTELRLDDKVLFYGALPYPEVARLTRGADAMVFFTRFESFGCVIAEALCAGLPVILSDLPVTHETVTEGVNGLFVPSGDEAALAAAIIRYMETGDHFNREAIARAAAERYGYASGARLLDAFYGKAAERLSALAGR